MSTQNSIAMELKMHFLELKDKSAGDIMSMVFRSSANLRLTGVGKTAYSRVHPAFIYKHDHNLLPRHLMGIAREITAPYYLSDTLFVIFSEEDAMMIKLCGGVNKFIETLG